MFECMCRNCWGHQFFGDLLLLWDAPGEIQSGLEGNIFRGLRRAMGQNKKGAHEL